jgi:hypothetical protein
MIKEFPDADVVKGKMAIDEYKGFKQRGKNRVDVQQAKQN